MNAVDDPAPQNTILMTAYPNLDMEPKVIRDFVDTEFRFQDWRIRVEPNQNVVWRWRAVAAKWLNSDFAYGQSPEDALHSLARKFGWNEDELMRASEQST